MYIVFDSRFNSIIHRIVKLILDSFVLIISKILAISSNRFAANVKVL